MNVHRLSPVPTGACVYATDAQHRDGGAIVIVTHFGLYPFSLKLYIDGGYFVTPIFVSLATYAVMSPRRVPVPLKHVSPLPNEIGGPYHPLDRRSREVKIISRDCEMRNYSYSTITNRAIATTTALQPE